MNIFVLDTDPVASARSHCNKHVVKMVLEYAQILCTVHQFLGTPDPDFYAPTHTKHPCVKWAMRSTGNYKWLYELFVATCDEYTYRYGRVHATDRLLRSRLAKVPKNLEPGGVTPFALAMPDECKVDGDAVSSYRNYYTTHKTDMLAFGYRGQPAWLIGSLL